MEGNLIGQARITYPNGDIYQGQVYNYEQHGRGFLYYVSGEKYEGAWKRGKIVDND